jgi:regulator of protease activity HflC (stomatin/prohibitin superfamily)
VLEAEGQAQGVLLAARAQAEAIEAVAAALSKEGGTTAAQLAVAQNYIEMYAEMGSKSNTMLFSDRPADINSLLAQAATVLKAAQTSGDAPKAIASQASSSRSSKQ